MRRDARSGKRFLVAIPLLLVGLRAEAVWAERSYDSYFDEAKEMADRGELSAAITNFERAATADPSQIDPLLNIGLLHSKAGRHAEARQVLQRARERFPTDPRPYYLLALVDMTEGEVGSGLRNYQQALGRGLRVEDDSVDMRSKLAQYTVRDFVVEYDSLRGNHRQPVRIRGNSSADYEMRQDILKALEKQEISSGRGPLSDIEVEFLRWKEGGAISEERWRVLGAHVQQDYLVTINSKPPVGFPYRNMITISEQE